MKNPLGKYIKLNTPRYAESADTKTSDIFLNITYEPYKQKLGKYFGSFISASFTDEPA